MTITLEAIKAEQSKIAAMIAAFEQQPAAPVFPITVPAPQLNDGEKAVAAFITADGSRRYWLILLPEKAEPADWKTQLAWAESLGGELPDRIEGATLNAVMNDEFEPEPYWTREQHAAYSDYAWAQYFDNGNQSN
jgi:hypothetical protein